jgi:hypothetical protein
MTITDIIRNEIADAIGHNPDKYELEKFITYIHDMISDKQVENKKIFLADVSITILECRDECFRQCEECSEYFLPEEMHDAGYKCLNCQPNFCEDDLFEKDYE